MRRKEMLLYIMCGSCIGIDCPRCTIQTKCLTLKDRVFYKGDLPTRVKVIAYNRFLKYFGKGKNHESELFEALL